MVLDPVLIKLFIAWIVITVIWIILLVYRARVSQKEDDQIFLGRGEEALQHEQESITRKMKRISPYLKITGLLSLVLLLVVIGMWIYVGLKTVNM